MSFEQEHANQILLKDRLKAGESSIGAYWNKMRFLVNYFGNPVDIFRYLRARNVGMKMINIDTPNQELVNPYLLYEDFIESAPTQVGEDVRPFLRQMVIDLLSYGVIHTDLHEKNLIEDKNGTVWVIDTASVKTIDLKTILQLIKLLRVLKERDAGKIFSVMAKLFPRMLKSKEDKRRLKNIVQQSLLAGSPLEGLLFLTREISQYNYDFLESLKSIISFKHLLELDEGGGNSASSEDFMKKTVTEEKKAQPLSSLNRDDLIDAFKDEPSVAGKEIILDELIRRGAASQQDDFNKFKLSDLYALFVPYTVKKDLPLSFRTKVMRATRLLGGWHILLFNLYQNYSNLTVLNDLRQSMIDDPQRLLFNVGPQDKEVQDYLSELLYLLQFHNFDEHEMARLEAIAADRSLSKELREIAGLILVNSSSKRVISLLEDLAKDHDSIDLETAFLVRAKEVRNFADTLRSLPIAPTTSVEGFDPVEFKKYIQVRMPQVLEDGSLVNPGYASALFNFILRKQEGKNGQENSIWDQGRLELMMPASEKLIGSRARALLGWAENHPIQASDQNTIYLDMFFYYLNALDQVITYVQDGDRRLRDMRYSAELCHDAFIEVSGLIAQKNEWLMEQVGKDFGRLYALVRTHLRTGGDVAHPVEFESLFARYLSHLNPAEEFYHLKEFLNHLRTVEPFFRKFPQQHRRIAEAVSSKLKHEFENNLSSLNNNYESGGRYVPTTYFGYLVLLIEAYSLHDSQGGALPEVSVQESSPEVFPLIDEIIENLLSDLLLNVSQSYTERFYWLENLSFLSEHLESFPRYYGLGHRIKITMESEKNIVDGVKIQNNFYHQISHFSQVQEEKEKQVLYEFNDDKEALKIKLQGLRQYHWHDHMTFFLNRLLSQLRNDPEAFIGRREMIASALREESDVISHRSTNPHGLRMNEAALRFDPLCSGALWIMPPLDAVKAIEKEAKSIVAERGTTGETEFIMVASKQIMENQGIAAIPEAVLWGHTYAANKEISYSSLLPKALEERAASLEGIAGKILWQISANIKMLVIQSSNEAMLSKAGAAMKLHAQANIMQVWQRPRRHNPFLGVTKRPGGIALTATGTSLEIRHAGEGIRFRIDPVMLKQLQNAPGFVPVIINIRPLGDLSTFLGLEPADKFKEETLAKV